MTRVKHNKSMPKSIKNVKTIVSLNFNLMVLLRKVNSSFDSFKVLTVPRNIRECIFS